MNKRNTSVTLGEEMDALIQGLIESGHFANASEVMRAGLRALEAEALRRELGHLCTCTSERTELASVLRMVAGLVDRLGEAALARQLRAVTTQLDRPEPRRSSRPPLQRAVK